MVRDWTKDYFHEKYECYCDMVYRICMLYLKNESYNGSVVKTKI